MIDFLNSFKSLLKLEKTRTNNNVFKLHYKFTVIILIVFSILLTSKQYFGEPIDCDVHKEQKTLVNTYCWIYGTFVLTTSLQENILPGLGPHSKGAFYPYSNDEYSSQGSDYVTQKYYQWVCIIFCFQALMFYIPHYLWKNWEAGRLRLLIQDLRGPLITPNWTEDSKKAIVCYFTCRKYSHNVYALRFALCELLNLINIVLQICLLDWFLTGHFSLYGIAVATYRDVNWMTMVFPKMTKCTYFRYGPSGSTETRDALCVLPLNIVNEKLFLFLWVWFYILAVLSLYQILYRALVLLSCSFREKLLRARCRHLNEKVARLISARLSFGDMFFLDLIAQNLNPLMFKELIAELYKQFSLVARAQQDP